MTDAHDHQEEEDVSEIHEAVMPMDVTESDKGVGLVSIGAEVEIVHDLTPDEARLLGMKIIREADRAEDAYQ